MTLRLVLVDDDVLVRSGLRVILESEPGLTVVNVRPVSADTLLPGSGMGLVGLRERVQLAGGVLESGPTPSGGFELCATLPLPGAA